MLYYILFLVFSTVLGSILVAFISRNRPAPGSRALTSLILAVMIWSVGYIMELLSPDLESKLFWGRFQYFGITTIPISWLYFSFDYLGVPRWLERWNKYRYVLIVIPFITFVLIWTNDLHGWIWRDVGLQTVGPVQMLDVDHGPFFWVYVTYGYLMLLAGTFRMVSGLFGSTRLRRWQISLALLAVLIPWAGNLVYIIRPNPFISLDWTPFSLSIASLIITVSLFRFRLVNILPIAHQLVFAGITDCVLVLDMQDAVLDLNAAAVKMIRAQGVEWSGRPLAQLVPALGELLLRQRGSEDFRVEFPWKQSVYEVHVTPLFSKLRRRIGRLLVCHEITRFKQQQAHLEQIVADRTEDLRETVEEIQRSREELKALTIRLQEVQEIERREIVSELHDCIGQNLTVLNLNLHIIENQLNPETRTGIQVRLAESLKLVEETTRKVRDVMADLHPPVLDDYGLVSALKWYTSRFSERMGIAVQVTGTEFNPRLPEKQELILFRIFQEALVNIGKHAHATRIEITIDHDPEKPSIIIKDDGQGFTSTMQAASGGQGGWGLIDMKQRAASIGARLSVESSPGQGTRVCVRFRRLPDDD